MPNPPGGIPPVLCPPGQDPIKLKFNKDSNGDSTQHGDYVGDFPCLDVSLSNLGSEALDTDLPRIYDSNIDDGLDPDLEIGKGKLLIIQQADSTEPNDNVNGGWMRFEFCSPTNIARVGIQDADENLRINFDGGNQITAKVVDNGEFQRVVTDQVGVNLMIIKGSGSFGVAWIELCQ